jgi:hypothetical protein
VEGASKAHLMRTSPKRWACQSAQYDPACRSRAVTCVSRSPAASSPRIRAPGVRTRGLGTPGTTIFVVSD